MPRIICLLGSAPVLALSAGLLSSQALAQDLASDGASESSNPAEIIVTARKTAERAIDAPLSVTVLTANDIASSGIQSTPDLIAFAPNVDMSGGIAGQLQGQVSIRGISTLARNIGLESGTSLFIDGVYAGRPDTFDMALLDVDQVDILRGPQGTEFGKNTIAGVIQIRTREPSDDPYLDWQVGGGNYGDFFARGTLNGPIAQDVDASASVGYSRHDGYYRHLSGGKDADSLGLLSWRAAVKFAPSDTTKFILRTDGLRDRSVPGFFQARDLAGFPPGFPGSQPHHIDNNRPDSLSRDDYGVSLTGQLELAGLDLTSITAYRHAAYDASLDDDQEQVDFVAADRFGDRSKLFTQELRAAGGSGPVKYLLGLYYFNQVVTTNRNLTLGIDLGVPMPLPLLTQGRVKTESEAAFGRLDYSPIERITVSLGLRYTHEVKRARMTQDDVTGILSFMGFPDLQYSRRSSDDNLSPTATVSVKLSPQATLYGRFARGFKCAAFNIDIASATDGLFAGPEKATSYEVGVKAELLDHRLSFGIDAFHVDYDDLQVSQILGGGISLTNAGRARAQGIEAEASLQAADWLRLQGSAGILDAKYKRFQNCGVPLSLGGGATDCSGNLMVMAPKFTAHWAVEVTQPVGADHVFARLDVAYRSSVFFEPTNSPRFEGRARALLNLRVGYARPSWQIVGWVENLTNKVYETYMDDRSAIGVLRTTAWGVPRTYGVTLSGRF
jgi:iron complex outermembrane receptor protein